MVTVRVCSKLKTSWKSVVFTNKVGTNSRFFMGVFNSTIIPLEPVGYERILAKGRVARSYAPRWLSTISYPTHTRGIIGIINRFWETAHLPLPEGNILP